MENVVVQVLNKEHGKEVIQAFKDLGVDTKVSTGSLISYYYGLFDGLFNYYSTSKESKVITLEELKAMNGEVKLTYPCMMEVWDDDETDIVKHNVVAEVQNNGFKGYVVAWNDDGDFVVYKNARPIQPDPLKEVVENMNSQIDTDKAYNKFDGDYKSWEEMRGVLLTPNEAQLIIDALDKNEM